MKNEFVFNLNFYGWLNLIIAIACLIYIIKNIYYFINFIRDLFSSDREENDL